jgi:hypothetical protein
VVVERGGGGGMRMQKLVRRGVLRIQVEDPSGLYVCPFDGRVDGRWFRVENGASMSGENQTSKKCSC